MEFTVTEMQQLASLLRPPEPEILQGEDLKNPTAIDIQSRRNDPIIPEGTKAKPKTIEEFEAQQELEFEQELDTIQAKKTPEYTMKFQQAVAAEDVYLQMGGKTPSTSSCENLIVTIKLPGDRRENMDLKVEKSLIELSSPNHKLKLPLPHNVDPDKSKAAWDCDTQSLVLTLGLVREFDYVNF